MRTVECSNCGDLGPQFWVTVGALAVATVALAFNAVQFRQFLRGLRKRARFRVTLRVPAADEDGVYRVGPAQKAAVRVEIGIKNEGGRAAGETLVNALAPER